VRTQSEGEGDEAEGTEECQKDLQRSAIIDSPDLRSRSARTIEAIMSQSSRPTNLRILVRTYNRKENDIQVNDRAITAMPVTCAPLVTPVYMLTASVELNPTKGWWKRRTTRGRGTEAFKLVDHPTTVFVVRRATTGS
jgi:hypothetical protein